MLRRITHITGRALPMRGNDIDTDRIIPARFLTSITFDGMEQHVFEDDRKSGGGAYNRHPFDVKHFQGAAVLLVNANFGCGSSREHAPQALHRWGIQVVIGESFAEIFFGNSGMIGMPCVTAAPADLSALMELAEREPSTEFAVDLVAGTCRAGALTVPVGDDTDLVAALGSVLDDPSRRAAMGATGRQVVEDRFDLERTSGDLLAAYETLVNPDRAGGRDR